MTNKNLKKFIRQQALRGQDPNQLRQGLIMNGWEQKDVDKIISEVYGFKKKVKKTSVIIILILVIIFSISLLLLFKELFSTEIVPEPPTRNGQQPIIDDSCASIDDITLKEDCYLEEIKQGFGCEDLTREETFFCNRVLESYLIGSLDD